MENMGFPATIGWGRTGSVKRNLTLHYQLFVSKNKNSNRNDRGHVRFLSVLGLSLYSKQVLTFTALLQLPKRGVENVSIAEVREIDPITTLPFWRGSLHPRFDCSVSRTTLQLRERGNTA